MAIHFLSQHFFSFFSFPENIFPSFLSSSPAVAIFFSFSSIALICSLSPSASSFSFLPAQIVTAIRIQQQHQLKLLGGDLGSWVAI